MLPVFRAKVKNWFLPREGELFLAAVTILVAAVSFGLGRLSALKSEKFPIQFIGSQNQAGAGVVPLLSGETAKSDKSSKTSPTPAGEKLYVGSKNGEVYHFPWCSGAQRMKEANKIFFSSREEAEKAGYRPAANCEGL